MNITDRYLDLAYEVNDYLLAKEIIRNTCGLRAKFNISERSRKTPAEIWTERMTKPISDVRLYNLALVNGANRNMIGIETAIQLIGEFDWEIDDFPIIADELRLLMEKRKEEITKWAIEYMDKDSKIGGRACVDIVNHILMGYVAF
jgi:hypothetical protein